MASENAPQIVSESVIYRALNMLEGLALSHQRTINLAYLRQDGALDVAFKLKFSEHKGGVRVGYEIAYVESKVKDGDHIIIDEAQLSMPFGDK